MKKIGYLALALLIVLPAGCASHETVAPHEISADGNREQKGPAPHSGPDVATASELIRDAASVELLWFVDRETQWSVQKQLDIQNEMRTRYYMAAPPIRLVCLAKQDFADRVAARLAEEAYPGPVFISSHQEESMRQLMDKGIISSYDAPDASLEAKEFFGSYFAMAVPKAEEGRDYLAELSGQILSCGELVERIAGPDLSKYITQEDERCFIYKGGDGDWDCQLQVDGSVTSYDIEGSRRVISQASYRFTAVYKPGVDELNQAKTLDIRFSSGRFGGSMRLEGPFDSATFVNQGGSRGGSVEDGSEVIQVTILMDGREQRMELRRDD